MLRWLLMVMDENDKYLSFVAGRLEDGKWPRLANAISKLHDVHVVVNQSMVLSSPQSCSLNQARPLPL